MFEVMPPMDRPRRRFAWHFLAAGAWWGIVGGFLELASIGIGWSIRPRVTVDSIRTNHHYLWMVPASNVLIVGAAGLALALLAWVRPVEVRRFGTVVLAALASLGAIRTIDQLHSFAGLVLAVGFGAMAMRWVASRENRFRRFLEISLIPMCLGLVSWTFFHVDHQLGSEARAVSNLPPAAKGLPNVLLLVMDNVRADDLSLYGYARDTSPNLKRLAALGAKFDRARSSASWTLPSHASMLTGRWPHELSVTVDTPLDSAERTLAEALSDRGYVTAGFVANTYYCNAWYGLDRGFSRYEDFDANREISLVETLRAGGLGHMVVDKLKLGVKEWPGDPRTRKTAARINGDLLGWLDAKPRDRPFFAFLNYYDAHEPFQPPMGSPRKYGLSARPESERAAILGALSNVRNQPAGVTSPENAKVVARAAELLRDSYDDCIASLDAQVGRLLNELERRGVLDDTLVILTADHGEEFNEKSLFGHGVSVYRPEVHVPLIVIPPKSKGSAAGRVVASAASLRDIPATVLAAVDAEPNAFPGDTLARFWTRSDAEPGTVLSEVEHQTKFAPNPIVPASLGPVSAVVEGRFVYIKNADGREEIYDHLSDPGETRNLAAEPGSAALLSNLRDYERRVVR